MADTRYSATMERDPMPIRQQSETHPRVLSLMNRVDEGHLLAMHKMQSGRKAVGVDKVTKEEYDRDVRNNLEGLVRRLKAFQYRPQPVRRTYIPKTNGKLRPLGIPSYEDKLVQGVMAELLSDVYEPRFLDCSYGFRPGRSAHHVVKFINDEVMRKPVNYVLEADIKGFFDNLDQAWLMRFLEHDIADRNFLRYVNRFLKAGIQEDAKLMESDKGTPQGGLISPVLANVYLHYALDLWAEKIVKPNVLGYASYVRYADDFLFMFQYREDAEKVMRALKNRLAKFGLELAEDKTRIVPIGRFNRGKSEFDFLGFTFFDAVSRKGFYKLGIRSSSKKIASKRAGIKQWLKSRMHQPMVETLKTIDRKLRGHYNYYGVNGNFRALQKFEDYVRLCTLMMLRRRSQRKKITEKKFSELWELFVSPPRITVQIWGQ